MQWNPWKQKTGREGRADGSLVAGNVQADFNEAARQVVAEQPETAQAPAVNPAPGDAEKLAMVDISEEQAREVVKACFWPLAAYVDPLWSVSDEEAQKASPRMRAFLNWFLMRYAPFWFLRIAPKYPELAGMLAAMALLTWHKYVIVRETCQAEAELEAKATSDFVRNLPAEVPVSGESIACELCKVSFPSREALAGHLPCNPA